MPIQLEAKVNEFLSLIMRLIFAFGLSFQLPILLTLLARVGFVSSKGLKKNRKFDLNHLEHLKTKEYVVKITF